MVLRERLREPDEGVSPVVGMILVLGISVVGIAAILYWGLPAIDEMKANVEHRSVESQFQELDSAIKELVAGTTERTAKRWQPTLNRGQVLLVNETESFLYAVETYHATRDYSFTYWSLTDRDHEFTIYNSAAQAISNAVVQAYIVNSTTSGQELRVNSTKYLAGTSGMGQELWPASDSVTFRLYDANAQQVKITNQTIRFRIFDGSAKIAEAFLIPTGRVDYQLDAGLGTKTVIENNGALMTGNGNTVAMINAPPVPPASTTSGIPRHFARAVVLNGTSSFAGDDRFDVLITLYSTSTLASYDCAKTDHSDCVERVKIFAFGKYADAWYSYLSNTGRGYTFAQTTHTQQAPGGSPQLAVPMTYLQDTDPWMGYTLLQSVVQIKGST